mgnify:CR=1 FL=1
MCLPRQSAHSNGGIGQICVVNKVTQILHLIDPETCQITEVNATNYFKHPFLPLNKFKDLVEYTVMELEPVLAKDRNKFAGQGKISHKHILAAASPVLRAMVENQHKESIQSKANIELSEDVGRAFIQFVYLGKLDVSLLKEHAPAFLELGEMYDLRQLKNAAERELVIQLDKKNMVRLLSIGETFRAGQLFEAALKMTKINIPWLRSQV